MKDSERVGLPVSIDADRSGNSHCVGLHLIALQIYTPCLVVATPVCDRDVGGLSCHAIAIIARQRGDDGGASGANGSEERPNAGIRREAKRAGFQSAPPP